MTNATRVRAQRAATAKLICVHRECRGERLEVPLSTIVYLSRQHPELQLGQVVYDLRHHGIQLAAIVSFCIDCACIYPVSNGHPR